MEAYWDREAGDPRARASTDVVIPDARWIAGAIGLANLLLTGWIRAARRNKAR